jgi:hypothetical protein
MSAAPFGNERRLSPHRLRCRFRYWLKSLHNERSRKTCYAMAASCFTRAQIERTVSWETPRSRATLRNPASSARAATSSHRSRGRRGLLVAMAYLPIPDRRREWSSRSGYRKGIKGKVTTSISRTRSPSLPPSQPPHRTEDSTHDEWQSAQTAERGNHGVFNPPPGPPRRQP